MFARILELIPKLEKKEELVKVIRNTLALRQRTTQFVGGRVPAGTTLAGAALAGTIPGEVWRV